MEKSLRIKDQPATHGTLPDAVSPLLQWRIKLNPCPWCGKTPLVSMPLESFRDDNTWVWEIRCNTHFCVFMPEGRHVAIRKSQRFDLVKIKAKLDIICAAWNSHDKYVAYEELIIKLDPLLDFIKKNPCYDKIIHDNPKLFSLVKGISCGPGWSFLIAKLSHKLEALIIKHQSEEGFAPYATDVKEKYGTLRFYMSTETEGMSKLIEDAEKDSAFICEICGKTGKTKEINGWFSCRCADHSHESLENIEQQYD